MENEPDQVPQQPNPAYQEQFQKQADIYNEQEKADYQKANEERSLAEKFIFRKPKTTQEITAVDMAHEEALTVDSVVNKAIEDGSEDTPQEIAETVLTSQEFGLKTPEELERRERLLRDGAEVVARVYSADIDDSWEEIGNATKQMSPEDSIQMRIALRELIRDYIATCIKAGDIEDLTKIALENSIAGVGGVEAYKDFPREIINLEAFQGRMAGHIEQGSARPGYTFESNAREVRSRADTVTAYELMDQESLKAVIEGEVIKSFCQTGIEQGSARPGYTFESNAREVRTRAEIVREQQLMTDELIDRVIKGRTIQEFCQTGIEQGSARPGYTFESNAREVRSRAEIVREQQLMTDELIDRVIKGRTIQEFCQTGIEQGSARPGYTFESNAREVRSRAEIVREQQLMEQAKADAIARAAIDRMRR